jgi:hypothetical protein
MSPEMIENPFLGPSWGGVLHGGWYLDADLDRFAHVTHRHNALSRLILLNKVKKLAVAELADLFEQSGSRCA